MLQFINQSMTLTTLQQHKVMTHVLLNVIHSNIQSFLHRIIEYQVGTEHKDHLIQPFFQKPGLDKLVQHSSIWILNMSNVGESTTSLARLGQWLIVLIVKNFPLVSNPNIILCFETDLLITQFLQALLPPSTESKSTYTISNQPKICRARSRLYMPLVGEPVFSV